ncbi:hypothetical protein Ahy_B02g058959 [Arachis hypogaea]|uniref:CCHC-type domain-containing protein n=1 Tax=Arachis hypogaea TaxID=3818 RepID=A0A445AFR6_ARAHY|nr:hypothetical protein Ahy_B02g058959 [Arachis hypogaea]
MSHRYCRRRYCECIAGHCHWSRNNVGPKVIARPIHTSKPNNTAGPKDTARPIPTTGHGIGEVDSEIFSDNFDGLGIPCVHVLTAIQKRCNRPEPYVHPWLKMDAFRATYEHVIRPINSEKYWKKIGLLAPEPSTIKKPPGRPTKKKRKPDPVEDARDATKERRTFMVTCQKCGQSDHNAKTCNGPPRPKSPPNVKENKQPRAKKNTSSAPPLQDEVQVSQTAPQSLPQEHTTNMSSGAVTTSVSRPPRPKQPIRRPHPTPTPTPTIYSSTFSRSHHLRTTTEAYPISIT